MSYSTRRRILINLTVLATCLAVARVADAQVQHLSLLHQQAIAPTIDEVRNFLQPFCATDAPDDYRPGFIGCMICPPFTSMGSFVPPESSSTSSVWTVVSIRYGHFTDALADQALVGTSGCEPH